jgi:hypothetical protein
MPPHPHLERLRRMLNNSETQQREVEAKLADAEAQLEESKFVIASLQASKASLQNTLNQSIKETDFGNQITILRQRSGEILESKEKLVEENIARKQHEYKTKNSLLRSFRLKEKDVDPVVLQRSLLGEQQGRKKQRGQAIGRRKRRVK